MAFKYDNLLNPLRNVLSMRRIDPITQIVLLLVVLPLTLIAAVFVGIAEGIRLSCLDNKVRKTLPMARQTRADEVKNANAIYYVIRKIEMKKYSLIHSNKGRNEKYNKLHVKSILLHSEILRSFTGS